MRRFAIENGKAVISSNGEFLHINDINLLLIEERRSVQNMIDSMGDRDDDWGKKAKNIYDGKIEVLNELENFINRTDS
jgi:hypothetical protein